MSCHCNCEKLYGPKEQFFPILRCENRQKFYYEEKITDFGLRVSSEVPDEFCYGNKFIMGINALEKAVLYPKLIVLTRLYKKRDHFEILVPTPNRNC